MAPRTLPGLGLSGFWALGEDGWKAGADANWLALSVLVQSKAISRTTALPGVPTNGDIYIVPSGAGSNANEIAIRDDGAWVYIVPVEGDRFYVSDSNENVQFDGAAWQTYAGSAAVDVSYDNATSGLTATDVQAAVDELAEGVATVEFSFFFGGTFLANEVLVQHIARRPFQLPAGLTGSGGVAIGAATGTPALTIRKNGASVGTATWAAAGTVPTLAMASLTSFALDDILTITAPASVDATLADVSLSLLGSLT